MKSAKVKGFVLYRIFYDGMADGNIVYVGRTKQSLQERIRGHIFKTNSLFRPVDIFRIQKIDYTELKTEADMFLYEIYYINKYHPIINRDDNAYDNLTVELPELEWTEFSIDETLWEKWKLQIRETSGIKAEQEKAKRAKPNISELIYKYRKQWHNGEITEEEFYKLRDILAEVSAN